LEDLTLYRVCKSDQNHFDTFENKHDLIFTFENKHDLIFTFGNKHEHTMNEKRSDLFLVFTGSCCTSVQYIYIFIISFLLSTARFVCCL